MGWWITLGILVLLAVLPLGVGVLYDADGAVVRIIAGPIKITLFPRPKKEKKPKKEKEKREKKPEKEASPDKPKKKKSSKGKKQEAPKKAEPVQPKPVQQAAPSQTAQPVPQTVQPASQEQAEEPEKKEKKKGGSVLDFLPLVHTVFDFLGDFRRKLRVNDLELKIILAGDDPCDLAVNYGRAWAALGNLLPRLERFLKIQKRDIDVQCDFTASETTIYARLELTITLGRILAAVFKFLFHAAVEFIKIMIKRKGGTKHEPESS